VASSSSEAFVPIYQSYMALSFNTNCRETLKHKLTVRSLHDSSCSILIPPKKGDS
jgi:hypothetical protein